MRIEPEIGGVTIVLLGNFNPSIFTPAWFELHNLLPVGTAAGARLEVAHREVTAFTTDRLILQAMTQRFSVETKQAPYVRIRDLVVRVFKECLPHTPVQSFGINREVHFPVRSYQEFDRVGKSLAPATPWGVWKDRLNLDGMHGGMTSLRMSQLQPEGRAAGGQINITVEPSKRFDHGRYGVYVMVNDHYPIDNVEALATSLKENFEQSLKRSDNIIDHLMSLATQ